MERLEGLRLRIFGDRTQDSHDDLINLLMSTAERKLLAMLNSEEKKVGIDQVSDVIPSDLEWVVDELTAKAFNSRGSEGFQSESVEGHSVVFRDDDLENYRWAVVAHVDLEHDLDNGRVGRVYIY